MTAIISILMWGLIITAILVLIKKISRKKKSKSEEGNEWPVKAKKTLLNEREQIVFHRLTEAFPDWIVLSQVALSQMITITNNENRASIRNKIDKKVVDFVICRPDTSIVAAVELDGNSHDSPRRMKSDDTKNSAMDAAGIKLLRINSKDLPNGQKLREAVAAP